MSAPMVLAIPSKGRLQANAQAVFQTAGLEILPAGGERSYRGRIAAIAGVEIAYLSAPEIAREIGAGAVHAGVTGRDQVEETVPDFDGARRIHRAARLRPLRRGGRGAGTVGRRRRRWKTSTTWRRSSARATAGG